MRNENDDVMTKGCRFLNLLVAHERNLRNTFNHIRNDLDDYESIQEAIESNFERWIWQSCSEGIENLLKIWQILYQQYRKEKWAERTYERKLLVTITKILTLYGQFEVIRRAN